MVPPKNIFKDRIVASNGLIHDKMLAMPAPVASGGFAGWNQIHGRTYF